MKWGVMLYTAGYVHTEIVIAQNEVEARATATASASANAKVKIRRPKKDFFWRPAYRSE